MALTTTPLPYGLRDVKLTAYTDAAGLVLAASSIDLPFSRTFSFTDSEDFDDLRGDDRLITSHGSGPQVDWELESGGIPFEAYLIMAGGTLTTTGTTPNQVKTLSKLVTTQRPYFKVEGQVISDSGGDIHCVLPRVKATGDLKGEFKDGAFWLTSAKGQGYPSLVGTIDEVYRFVQNETAVAIP